MVFIYTWKQLFPQDSWKLPFYPYTIFSNPHLFHKQILLVFALQCIQNSANPYHLHCYCSVSTTIISHLDFSIASWYDPGFAFASLHSSSPHSRLSELLSLSDCIDHCFSYVTNPPMALIWVEVKILAKTCNGPIMLQLLLFF